VSGVTPRTYPFRPRRAPGSQDLAARAMDEVTLYRVILGYLQRLPGAIKEVTGKDGKPKMRCDCVVSHRMRMRVCPPFSGAPPLLSQTVASVSSLLAFPHPSHHQGHADLSGHVF
jgi:hypothetical protein